MSGLFLLHLSLYRCQSVSLFVHRSSFILATCPAHRHFCFWSPVNMYVCMYVCMFSKWYIETSLRTLEIALKILTDWSRDSILTFDIKYIQLFWFSLHNKSDSFTHLRYLSYWYLVLTLVALYQIYSRSAQMKYILITSTENRKLYWTNKTSNK